MTTLFDQNIERRRTGSLKWDIEPSLLPYWVADMDFESPPCVMDALRLRVDHGVFGYALPPEGFEDVLLAYMLDSHGASIRKDWLVHMGGCVPALAVTAMSVCGHGGTVMTCSPVYPPIRSVHECAGAGLIEVPHIMRDGVWTFDWQAMEDSVRPDTRLFILCNPQNPLGRVFSREELLLLAEFCDRHNLVLCADEIHCDLVLDENVRHVSALTLPDQYLERVIVLTAPSKTYNIAGIGYSMAVIPSDRLRQSFERLRHLCQPPVHCLAYAAAMAAYAQGGEWRMQLIDYLRGNRDALYRFAEERMPGVVLKPMQATYLAWLDCSALGMDDLPGFFSREAGVLLNSGEPFGAPDHVRFNFGTSRANMLRGLELMVAALETS